MGKQEKIEFRELCVDNVADIVAIEKEMHDESLLYGEQTITACLHKSIDDGADLSFGMFKGEELVGYLLCFGLEPSHFPQYKGEYVVYIDDITVLPKHRRLSFRLLTVWYAAMRKKFPESALEAHVLEEGRELWQRHNKMLTSGGLDFQLCEDTGQEIAGQRRYRIRWRQVDYATDRPDYSTHLASLPGKTYRINGEEYSVRQLQRERDWLIYESVWDSLVKQSTAHNLFQGYDFLRHWWQHFGHRADLFILFICKGEELIGIAPFNILKRKIRGLTFKEVGFIGSPFEVDRPRLIMARDEAEGVQAVVRYLGNNKKAWDLLQIFEQLKDDSLVLMKQTFRDCGLWVGAKESSVCPYLDCNVEWDAFLAERSRKFRKNLRAAERKLESQGNLHYRVYREWLDIEEQLAVYCDIEGRSWKASQGVGIVKTPQCLAFYYSIAEAFAEKGDFCMRVLTLDEKPIAATFGIYFDEVFYSLQITHDKAYKNASPGTYLESLELQECFAEEGCREYDFLGGFLNNKSRWSSTARLTESLHVYQRSPLMTLVYMRHFVIDSFLEPILCKEKAKLK